MTGRFGARLEWPGARSLRVTVLYRMAGECDTDFDQAQENLAAASTRWNEVAIEYVLDRHGVEELPT